MAVLHFIKRSHNQRLYRKNRPPPKPSLYVEQILMPSLFANELERLNKKHTVGESVEKYLAYCKITKGARTFRNDKLVCTKRFREYFKDETNIVKITKSDIKEYLLSIQLSPQSIFNQYSSIRAFFNFLKDDDTSPIKINPCEKLDKFLPKVGSEVVKYHEQEQVDTILALAKNYIMSYTAFFY